MGLLEKHVAAKSRPMSLVWYPKGISFGHSPPVGWKQLGFTAKMFEDPGDCHTSVRTGSQ